MTSTDTTAVRDRAGVRRSIRFWALVALVLYVVSGAAFAGFSYLGDAWATASDATAVLLAAVLLVLVLRFDDLFGDRVGGITRLARRLGVAGTTVALVGGVAVVAAQVGVVSSPTGAGLTLQFIGWGLLGGWFILAAHLGQITGLFSRRWTWSARIVGAGQVVAMAATIPLGPDSVLASVGYGAAFVAVILWALWTRQELTI